MNIKYDPQLTEIDRANMRLAIKQARTSVELGGFPAGSVLTKDGIILSQTISLAKSEYDQMSHSDIEALFENKGKDLKGSALYSSVAPCLMCLMAAYWAGVDKIVYACRQSKLNEEYYGTKIRSKKISSEFLRHIIMIHAQEFEEDSLNIVKEWEKNKIS